MSESEEDKSVSGFLESQLFQINWRMMGYTLLAILLGFLIGGLIIWLAGHSPLVLYTSLFKGAFSGKFEIGTWLSHSSPIILTSLAFIVVYKSGLFNIGAEGQLYIGAFAAAWAGFALDLPKFIHVVVAVLFGIGAGAAWGFIPGVLKAKRDANEFVTSLMLSYVAIQLTSWFVSPGGPFKDPGSQAAQSPSIAGSAHLPRILPPSQLSVAFIIAIIAGFVIFYLLRNTTLGFEMRVVGTNQDAARFAGINVDKSMILSFVIGGALAGLAGAGVILGNLGRFVNGFSPGYGWDGIAGALIGRGHPLGAILASLLLGALRAGSMRLDRVTTIPYDIAMVIEGVIIFFVIVPPLLEYLGGESEDGLL